MLKPVLIQATRYNQAALQTIEDLANATGISRSQAAVILIMQGKPLKQSKIPFGGPNDATSHK